MRKEFLHHYLAYTILILALALIVLSFFTVWPNIIAQRYLILILSAFYFMWGVISHTKTDHITTKVIVEYLAVSVLAGLLLSLVTF